MLIIKLLIFYKKHKYFILLSLLYFLSRLIYLDTDFHVLEPDEGLFYGLSQYFKNGKWPIYYSHPFLETFPLFLFLGGMLDKLTHNFGIFLSLRLFSILGTYLSGIAFYLYGLSKKNLKLSHVAPLLFWLNPLIVFYSRTGTMEMLYLGFATLSIVLFFTSTNNSNRRIFLSSLFFSLSILIKFTAVIFIFSFLIFTYFKPQKRIMLIKFAKQALLIISILLIPYFLYFQKDFIYQAVNYPGQHLLPILNLKVHLANLYIYFQKIPYLISPVISTIYLISLIIFSIKNKKQIILLFQKDHKLKQNQLFILEFLSLLLPGFLFIFLFNFSQRYLILLIPSTILLCSHYLTKIKNNIILSLIFISILPHTYNSFIATLHTSIRELENKIKILNAIYPDYPIYSTVDPEKLSFYFNQNVKLLDLNAFQKSIIITDNLKTELFSNFKEANFKEMKSILDCLPDEKIYYQTSSTYNHFPVNNRTNTFTIYLIKEEDNQKYQFNDFCAFRKISS